MIFKGDLKPLAKIPTYPVSKQPVHMTMMSRQPISENIIIKYFFQKIPLSKNIAKTIFSRYKLIVDPLNLHSILPKKDFIKFYFKRGYLGYYLVQRYLYSVEKGEFTK
jgi:hypothetical protein